MILNNKHLYKRRNAMNRTPGIIAATVLFMFCVTQSFAAITVVSVKGECAYATHGGWAPLQKGQTLAEGTKISTGLKSKAVLDIDGSTLTVEPVTMMKIYRNSVGKKVAENSIGLKYGTLDARVKRVGSLKTKFKITTPVATSSVRGTWERVSYGPAYGMLIQVLEGTVEGSNDRGVSRFVSGRMHFSLGHGNQRPDDPLGKQKDGSEGNITPDNITKDEKDFREFFGDQFHDSSDDGQGFLDIINPGGTGKVNLNLDWSQVGF
jgi:hypothetical protein